jgi:hypothetical protein
VPLVSGLLQPSVDRIDRTNTTYLSNNVHITHLGCNFAKNKFEIDEFEEWLEMVTGGILTPVPGAKASEQNAHLVLNRTHESFVDRHRIWSRQRCLARFSRAISAPRWGETGGIPPCTDG